MPPVSLGSGKPLWEQHAPLDPLLGRQHQVAASASPCSRVGLTAIEFVKNKETENTDREGRALHEATE